VTFEEVVTFEQVRAAFPVLGRVAYLNAGTNGPLAAPTVAAMEEALGRELREGRAGQAFIDEALALRRHVRGQVGELLAVDPSLVVLTASTTDGCNIVLAGLGLGSEDEVVTTSSEHFGLLGPLHASGARVVVATPEPEAIVAAVGPRTRLVAVSHVLWTTGRRLPVHELREATGVPVLVDGAQSAGAVAVSATGVDFYTVSGQKWLCGPGGSGGLYVADPERLRIARPSYFAQSEHAPDGSFTPREGAERFEPNWTPVPTLAGFSAALDFPPDWRYERGAQTAARCRDRLRRVAEVEPGDGTLVAFRPEGEEPAAVVERLAAAGVIVREIPRTGLVRVSCGYWTSDEDLDRLLAALE
jgi:L-cysteine/cystine lyase